MNLIFADLHHSILLERNDMSNIPNMYGSNNYKESLSRSQAGIPRKVKLGPYIFPTC